MTTELDKLREPFPDEVIESYQVAGRDVWYADARAYMDRLDQVVGPERWATTYEVLDKATCAVECRLSLNFDGTWVTKIDIGYPNDAKDAADAKSEPLKAAYSDALKRAAVQWGVGRFLYHYNPSKQPIERKPLAASTKKDVQQWGSFLGDGGVFDTDKWEKAYKPVSQEIANLTGGDIKAWLKRHPSKSLDDLIKEATPTQEPVNA